MNYKSVAVFCGSKSGNNSLFEEHALLLGKIMAQKNMQLIYGGGRVGLMGTIANAVMQNGGKVIGIIPKVLLKWEQQHHDITELRIVEDMHERKRMMYELCDAAIILPGGNGTLDELFELITWNTLKIHEKKIILLKNMQQEGFLHEDWQMRISIHGTPETIF